MGETVYIDQEDGKKRVMNNAKLYAKLLGKFRNETQIDPVFEAINAGEWEKAQVQAHTVKGVTANLSIKELNLRIQELEAQIKAKAVKPETIEAVKSCFAETLVEVDKVLAQNA
jgi:HPt (histidine-containing phosphotransfer) domain-containing protein